jgi:hypothetical protein
MGSASSTCKHKKLGKVIIVIHDKYIGKCDEWSIISPSSIFIIEITYLETFTVSPMHSNASNKSFSEYLFF